MVHGRPDDTLAARVSRAEPTLVRVDGSRIRRVFGAEGKFTVTADKHAGTAYLTPTTDDPVLSIFVADDTGKTWKLLLSVVDAPAETIVIKERAGSATRNGKDEVRNRAIKRVILALNSTDGDGLDVHKVNDVVPLWDEVMFVRVAAAEGELKGEKYLLTNTSDKPMVIDERELYRRGVVAVSVERPELGPGETTAVYVVMESRNE